MLVLNRRQSEVIQIGEDIFVQVVRIGTESIRLGITAPNGVPILRGELVIPKCHVCGDPIGDDEEQATVDGKAYCCDHLPNTINQPR